MSNIYRLKAVPNLFHQLQRNSMKSLCKILRTSYLTLANVATCIILNIFDAQFGFQIPSKCFHLLAGASPAPSLRGLQGTISALDFEKCFGVIDDTSKA